VIARFVFADLGKTQRQLSRRACVKLNEIGKGTLQVDPIDVGPALELGRELVRHVARPSLACVESDDAHRVAILAGLQVLKRRLSIALRGIGLAIDPAKLRAEILLDNGSLFSEPFQPRRRDRLHAYAYRRNSS
jgi:hypothetical protein